MLFNSHHIVHHKNKVQYTQEQLFDTCNVLYILSYSHIVSVLCKLV